MTMPQLYFRFFSILFFFLCPCCPAEEPLLEMGRWSYGSPRVCSWGENAHAKVGNFCSIADGVTIMLGGEHRPDWVTTFPFSFLWSAGAGIPGHPKTKGNVTIGHDVWLGMDAFILSGVTIGTGAVVGACTVVAKDVPPYAIVVGNPARIIKYRFDPDTISSLLKAAWWDWPDEEIAKALPYLLSEDLERFFQHCHSMGRL